MPGAGPVICGDIIWIALGLLLSVGRGHAGVPSPYVRERMYAGYAWINVPDASIVVAYNNVVFNLPGPFVELEFGGGSTACGRTSENSIRCLNLPNPPPYQYLHMASTGQNNYCALRADTNSPVCWGDGTVTEYTSRRYSQIDGGCGIRLSDGRVDCFLSTLYGNATSDRNDWQMILYGEPAQSTQNGCPLLCGILTPQTGESGSSIWCWPVPTQTVSNHPAILALAGSFVRLALSPGLLGTCNTPGCIVCGVSIDGGFRCSPAALPPAPGPVLYMSGGQCNVRIVLATTSEVYVSNWNRPWESSGQADIMSQTIDVDPFAGNDTQCVQSSLVHSPNITCHTFETALSLVSIPNSVIRILGDTASRPMAPLVLRYSNTHVTGVNGSTLTIDCAFATIDTSGGACLIASSWIRDLALSNVLLIGGSSKPLLLIPAGSVSLVTCLFRDSSAGAIVGTDYGLVTLTGCRFMNVTTSTLDVGSAGSVVDIVDRSLTIRDGEFTDNLSARAAISVASTLHVAIAIQSCRFERNSGADGCVSVFNAVVDEMTVISSSFVDNVGTDDGGAITLTQAAAGSVMIADCRFIRNAAQRNGGAVSVNTTLSVSSFTIAKCSWLGNSAAGNGGSASILLLRLCDGQSFSFSNNHIVNSTAGDSGGAVYYSGTLVDSHFVSNVMERTGTASNGGALYLDGRAIQLVDFQCRMARSVGHGGCVFAASDTTSTNVDIRNSTFESNAAGLFGGAVYTSGVLAQVSACVCSHNIAQTGGGWFVLNTQLMVTNVSFSANRATGAGTVSVDQITGLDGAGGAIAALSSTSTFMFSSFVNNSAADGGGAISLLASFASVANSSLSINSAASGGAIWLGSQSALFAEDSTFYANTAGVGGAVTCTQCATFEMTATQLTSNVATGSTNTGTGTGAGGAVFVSAQLILMIQGCALTGNSAVVGSGGAIFFDTSGTSSSQFRLIDVLHGGNSAPQGGGGFAFWSGRTNVSQLNVYTTGEPNTALYGSDWATPPIRITLLSGAIRTPLFAAPNVVPPIVLAAVDSYGSNVLAPISGVVFAGPASVLSGTTQVSWIGGNATFIDLAVGQVSSTVVLTFSAATTTGTALPTVQFPITVGWCHTGHYFDELRHVCLECGAGFVSNGSLAACAACGTGRYSNATTGDTCSACQRGRYAPSAGASVCFDCPAGMFGDDLAMSSCSTCAPGTFQDSTGVSSCVQCMSGRFSPSYGGTGCQNCPIGTVVSLQSIACVDCVGPGLTCYGDQLVVWDDYWLVPFNTTTSLNTGTNDTHIFRSAIQCPFGICHGGTTTGTCSANRAAYATNVMCGSCESGYSNWNDYCQRCTDVHAGMLLLVVVVSIGLVFAFHELAQSATDNTLNALLYFVGTLRFVLGSSNNWMRWISFLDFAPSNVTSVCLFPISPYGKIYWSLLSPLLFSAAVWFIAVIHWASASSRLCRFRLSEFRVDRYIRTFVCVLIASYTTMSSTVFMYLSCTNYALANDQPVRVVFNEPDVNCESAEYHAAYRFLLSVLAVFVVLVPVGVGALVFVIRWRRLPVSDDELKVRFGSLYAVYHKRVYWWGWYSLCRRLLLTTVGYLLSHDSLIRSQWFAVINGLLFGFHFYQMPYLNSIDNHFESVVLAFLVVASILNTGTGESMISASQFVVSACVGIVLLEFILLKLYAVLKSKQSEWNLAALTPCLRWCDSTWSNVGPPHAAEPTVPALASRTHGEVDEGDHEMSLYGRLQ